MIPGERRSRLRLACTAALAIASAWLAAAPAHAFRNKARFGDPAADGGGGERYFTGSRAEGYTCQVCHSAGTPVPLQITGVPIAGYEPGQRYRISIDWPDDLPSVAVNVEMTDFDGDQFGALIVPDPATLTAADTCRERDIPDASQNVVLSQGRRVLLIGECGQAQTSFDWQAPSGVSQGFLTGSLLVSNRDGKVRGDRVVDFSRAFGAVGAPAPTVDAYAGHCSARPAGGARGHGTLPSYLLICGLLLLRRRARR